MSEQKDLKVAGEEKPTPRPYWKTDKATVFRIGGREFELIHVGLPQKTQLGRLKGFLAQTIKPILEQFPIEDRKRFGEGDIRLDDLIPLIEEALDPELYQQLGEILLLESPQFVEEYYDLGWIVDGAGVVLEYNYGIKRLIEAFFPRK